MLYYPMYSNFRRLTPVKKVIPLLFLCLLLGFSTSFPVFANEDTTTEDDIYNNTTTEESTLPEDLQEIAPINVNEIEFEINKNLSPDQISERFLQINSSYKIEEPFSPEDSEFVRAYAEYNYDKESNIVDNSNGIQAYSIFKDSASKSFSKTGYKKFGVTVSFTGKVYSTLNVVNHSYRGNIKTKITAGSSKVKSIKHVITNVAYGAIGTSGTIVGIVSNTSMSDSTTSSSLNTDKTKKYTAALVVYTNTNAYTAIKTNDGTFNLYAL